MVLGKKYSLSICRMYNHGNHCYAYAYKITYNFKFFFFQKYGHPTYWPVRGYLGQVDVEFPALFADDCFRTNWPNRKRLDLHLFYSQNKYDCSLLCEKQKQLLWITNCLTTTADTNTTATNAQIG